MPFTNCTSSAMPLRRIRSSVRVERGRRYRFPTLELLTVKLKVQTCGTKYMVKSPPNARRTFLFSSKSTLYLWPKTLARRRSASLARSNKTRPNMQGPATWQSVCRLKADRYPIKSRTSAHRLKLTYMRHAGASASGAHDQNILVI